MRDLVLPGIVERDQLEDIRVYGTEWNATILMGKILVDLEHINFEGITSIEVCAWEESLVEYVSAISCSAGSTAGWRSMVSQTWRSAKASDSRPSDDLCRRTFVGGPTSPFCCLTAPEPLQNHGWKITSVIRQHDAIHHVMMVVPIKSHHDGMEWPYFCFPWLFYVDRDN